MIYVGARTGRDGIHGASMASAEFTEESKQKRPNVQMGDPFMEKLLLEACLEGMQTGAIVGIQDMGAAGLTCSTCEMGSRGEVGIEIELDRVPQRETGMTPYEIMLSESQERMLLVADKGREDEVFAVFRKWGLEAVEIGVVTGRRQAARAASRRDRRRDPESRAGRRSAAVRPAAHRRRCARAPLDAPARCRPPTYRRRCPRCSPRRISAPSAGSGSSTITRSAPTRSPGPGYDAAIIRIKETGTSVAMALDGNGRYCYLSPREGARLAVAEAAAISRPSARKPVAATNCLNFGNPERPEIMAQLVEAIEGMSEACRFFDTPITGGNVSLYNETLGEGIYPTPVIGIVGTLNTAPPVPLQFQDVGPDADAARRRRRLRRHALRQQPYAKEIVKHLWGLPPALDMEYEQRVQYAIRRMIDDGLVESAHDLSDGGLAVALAECSFGPAEIGAQVDLVSHLRPEVLMFHEAPSRILISTANPETCRGDRGET